MIDTIFFLLVFFMMASLAMTTQTGLKVNLPRIKGGKRDVSVKATVTLTAQRKLYLDKRSITWEQLTPLLKERIEQNPRLTVVVNVDKAVRWQEGITVMDAVSQAEPYSLQVAGEPASTHRGGQR